MPDVIRIGTRGSLLATTQAGGIRDALLAKGHHAELVIISTAGDQSHEPIADIGVGVFTAALREAIAAGQVDMAVHSYKDLPTAADQRFVIAAIPPREDATRRAGGPRRVGAGRVAERRNRGHVVARDGPRSLEHWVSVWKFAPYEAT